MDIPVHTTAKQLIFSSFCYFSPSGPERRMEPPGGPGEGAVGPWGICSTTDGVFPGCPWSRPADPQGPARPAARVLSAFPLPPPPLRYFKTSPSFAGQGRPHAQGPCQALILWHLKIRGGREPGAPGPFLTALSRGHHPQPAPGLSLSRHRCPLLGQSSPAPASTVQVHLRQAGAPVRYFADPAVPPVACHPCVPSLEGAFPQCPLGRKGASMLEGSDHGRGVCPQTSGLCSWLLVVLEPMRGFL